MLRCIQLAKNGLGTTYPNPLVGSVIVHNQTIIGEGWHYKAGKPHAEVNAINSVKNKSLLKDATIYVSLEPCSHFGKTPPCANLIIESGIKHVVVGSVDPNPKVSGSGIKKLIEAGCDVSVGILEKECDSLNKRFFVFQKLKRPFIFLKWAETANGFIAPITKNKVKPVWISNSYSRQLVHKLRGEEQAILVGTQTVLDDNPGLTTRDWFGKNPIRVVVDKTLKIPTESSIYNNLAKTIIFTEKVRENTANTFFEIINFSENIVPQICDVLVKYEIQSIIIEGGSKILQSFIDINYWDEAIVFKGISTFKEGIKAPILNGLLLKEEKISTDTVQYFKNITN